MTERIEQELETYAGLIQAIRSSQGEGPLSSSSNEPAVSEEDVRELAFYASKLSDEGLINLHRGPDEYWQSSSFRAEYNGDWYRLTEEGEIQAWGDDLGAKVLATLGANGHKVIAVLLWIISLPFIEPPLVEAFLGLACGFYLAVSEAGFVPLQWAAMLFFGKGWKPWGGVQDREKVAKVLAKKLNEGLAELDARQGPNPNNLLANLPERLSSNREESRATVSS